VGHRLALAARAIAYGEQVEFSGPLFRDATVEGHVLRVWFTHADQGLVAKGGALTGFELAGSDHKFSPADTRVDGHTVVASSAQVAHPVYVRYAWENVPQANLFNTADLPASPFTSEPTPSMSRP
jgi:sialate O-acetylesterase